MKLIAYYLPQFHTIPENDKWWGKGFTEWKNVTRAKPLFDGHYQPRLPADLGFYDLRVESVRRQQADLAKSFGIHGFCYYYYWFDGKKLLDTPLNSMLKDKSMDLPFCLCYANENWSRRWDGSENEVLMKQEHGVENDRRFINEIIPYMLDERYITVNGKPMLLVYRAQLFPDIRKTAEVWREEARKAGIQDLYLCKCETFGDIDDPAKSGFDANVEFPPHNTSVSPVLDYDRKVSEFTGEPFKGSIYDYKEAAYSFMSREQAEFVRFKTVMLGWDNTARKRLSANIFTNFDIDYYELWLAKLIRDSIVQHEDTQKRFVFINAWNEWAEGTYLEPDQKYGYEYLKATKRALVSASKIGAFLPLLRSIPHVDRTALNDYLDQKERMEAMLMKVLRYKDGQILGYRGLIKAISETKGWRMLEKIRSIKRVFSGG